MLPAASRQACSRMSGAASSPGLSVIRNSSRGQSDHGCSSSSADPRLPERTPLSSERFCEWVLDGKLPEAADVRLLNACLAAEKAIGILDPPDGAIAKAFAVTEPETHQWAQSFASSSQRKCCLKCLCARPRVA